MTYLCEALNATPIIANLVGVKPEEVLEVGDLLVQLGFKGVEVPLSSPEALLSIEILANMYGDKLHVGAGSVVSVDDVEDVGAAGGTLSVSPRADVDIIERANRLEMIAMPSVVTEAEATLAVKAGARYLRFPSAETNGVRRFKAIRALLPPDVRLAAAGGISSNNLLAWFDAGADGVGISSALYKPGLQIEQIAANARSLMESFRLWRSYKRRPWVQ